MNTVATRSIVVERFANGTAEWDGFVASAEGATHCHAAAWREVIADVLGHEPVYLCARGEEGEIIGGLPLVRVRSRLTGDYLLSMPFLNAGGPVGAPETCRALVGRGLDIARGLGVDLFELRSRRPVYSPLPVSHRKVRVTLALPGDADDLWRSFASKLRSQIRRPLKDGMEARFGADQLDAFYDVFSENMRRLGTPVLPRSFFDRAAALFGDAAVVGVVYSGTRPVAGGFGVLWRGELELAWASSLREFSRSSPNMLLYWRFLERSIERGAHTFDFGRSSPGSGPHRFKLQWGGEEFALPWAFWSSRRVVTPPTTASLHWRVASAAWRRIPLSWTRRLGPRLARVLP